MAKIAVGDRVVSCGTIPGFHNNGNYYAPKIYEAAIRKKDNVLVWRLSYTAADLQMAVAGWLPTTALYTACRRYAKTQGLPFVKDVKHNDEISNRTQIKKPKTTRKRVIPETGEVVVEDILVGRFRRIDDDDII